ncbi:MAG: alpha/beta hydrolase [Acidimicrobiia bacterium]|nr:alpha/beta hydrolase [Acidimicrobiia bacterium]MDH4308286.1 alpha/beta hydrolase [Acidimicrobiia bacterium]MDH5292625.1 alpha/beta hydrolase [Acidimicrobiia bacterium]
MPLRAFGPLFGQVYGSGTPAVIALHGWGRRGSDFDAVLAGVDAVAFDLPGFGATPAPETPMGAAGYADVVETAIAELGEGPYVVVGHSFGGRIGTVLAARRPDLVRALVLTGVPLLRRAEGRRPPASYRLVRWLHARGLVSDARMEKLKRSRGSADYRAATGVMRDVLVTVVNESYADELAALRCPVTLLWGAEDTDVPPSIAVRAAELIPGPVTLDTIDGVGHLTVIDAPSRVRQSITEAMSS